MSEILERGEVFFLYRPKIDAQVVHSLDDIQRFYMILKPEERNIFRRIIIGRKHIPDVDKHERTWGFVDLVTRSAARIEDELDPVQYATKTRGARTDRQPGRSAKPSMPSPATKITRTSPMCLSCRRRLAKPSASSTFGGKRA